MNFGQLLVRSLPIALEGKATGGGTTTIIDTLLSGKYDDDAFKDALAFIRQSTDGLAPQDQFSVLSAYNSSTQTFTVDTAYSAVVGAGDYYAIADPAWPLPTVQRLANQALRKLGVISLTDDSIVLVNNERRYTLPEAIWGFPLDLVEIGNNVDGWTRMEGAWRVVYPESSADSHFLEFDLPPFVQPDIISGNVLYIRIWYRGYHWNVGVYGDKISHTIPEPLAVEYLKNELLDYLIEKDGYINDEMMRRLQIQRGNLSQVRTENRVHNAPRKISRFLSIGRYRMR